MIKKIKHTNDLGPCPRCEEKLLLAHPDIAQWFREKVKPRHQDCHIAWSYRSKEDQEHCFLIGKTTLHYPLSPHNKTDDQGNPCSLALDLFELDFNGIARFSWGYCRVIAEEANKDGCNIFWGGHWASLGDFVHFQINKPQDS